MMGILKISEICFINYLYALQLYEWWQMNPAWLKKLTLVEEIQNTSELVVKMSMPFEWWMKTGNIWHLFWTFRGSSSNEVFWNRIVTRATNGLYARLLRDRCWHGRDLKTGAEFKYRWRVVFFYCYYLLVG